MKTPNEHNPLCPYCYNKNPNCIEKKVVKHGLFHGRQRYLCHGCGKSFLAFEEPIISLRECPYCKSSQVSRHGHARNGEQRYRCRSCHKMFLASRMTAYISEKYVPKELRCPQCKGLNMKKNGCSKGIQRYLCLNPNCGRSFSAGSIPTLPGTRITEKELFRHLLHLLNSGDPVHRAVANTQKLLAGCKAMLRKEPDKIKPATVANYLRHAEDHRDALDAYMAHELGLNQDMIACFWEVVLERIALGKRRGNWKGLLVACRIQNSLPSRAAEVQRKKLLKDVVEQFGAEELPRADDIQRRRKKR
jgi:transposase-like protein